ncbi:MAG: hypothetical protein ACK50P_15645 [Planctomycetaceae bacterium]
MPTSETPAKGAAVAWLATWVTLVAGGGCCTLIAVAMNADWREGFRSAGPIVAGIAFLWWLLRDRQPGSSHAERWSWLKRRRKIRRHVKIARTRPTGSASVPLSGPPTAESVRELKGGINTWVPSERPRTSPRPPPG